MTHLITQFILYKSYLTTSDLQVLNGVESGSEYKQGC